MKHDPAPLRAEMPKLPADASDEEFDAWMEALPPCPGIGFADDDDEDMSDAEIEAEIAAGRVYPHSEVSAWLQTWGSPDYKPFHEWRK